MKKRIIIVVISILALAILVGGGIWQWKKAKDAKIVEQNAQQGQIKKADEQEQINQAVVDTSDWKIYMDEKYGFEIKHDPDWGIRNIGVAERGEEEILYITINASDGRPLFAQPPVQAWEVASDKNPKTWWTGKKFMSPIKKIIEEKDYLINENATYFAKVEGDKRIENYYVISNGKSIICFYFEERAERVVPETGRLDSMDFSKYLPKFEAMVNSIRFID